MADSDELLNPEEIEALFKAAKSSSAPSEKPSSPPAGKSPSPSVAAPSGPQGDLLDPSELEALFQQRAVSAGGSAQRDAGRSAESLLNRAEADLSAAMGKGPASSSRLGVPPQLGTPEKFEFSSFDSRAKTNAPDAFGLQALEDVQLDLRIELGRTQMLIEEVLKLREGSVVALDKLAGDPVDILVNGRLVARGEVLVLNDNFCVRVAEILSPDF